MHSPKHINFGKVFPITVKVATFVHIQCTVLHLVREYSGGVPPPVLPCSLCEHDGHQALDILPAGVQRVDDGHARVIARPQRPVPGNPCP